MVSPDASWCSQCFRALEAPVSSGTADGSAGASQDLMSGSSETGPGAISVQAGKPAWTCAVCRSPNPIEASLCVTCGAPFSRLLEERDPRPEVEPQTAAAWSMVLPGIGHWKLGRRTDALARFAMFGWAFGALLILLVSRFGQGGLGPTLPLFLLFLGASVVIYVFSAVDAYRIASGNASLVSSRVLLWASAGLVFVSVLIATFVTLPAARR